MPIATAAADTTLAAGKSPADDVWLLAGQQQQHGRLWLTELPVTDPNLDDLPIHPPQPERKNGRATA
jgi:hypothetical protein